jgi:hypothetical protein
MHQYMQIAIIIYALIIALRDDAAFRVEESERSVREIKSVNHLYARALVLMSVTLVALIVAFAVFVHQ